MQKVHYITIAVAAGLIILLYLAVPTFQSKKTEEHIQPLMGGEAREPQKFNTTSFDSVLLAARTELPASAVKQVDSIENELKATREPLRMAFLFRRLASTWQQHNQMPVAANYYAEAAKLENSEKNLNFAGSLFLGLMHGSNNAALQNWEAQQAIACFKRSLEINPGNDTAKIGLATGYIEGTGETMQGVQLLLGITRQKPDDIPANTMLGKLSVQSGQYDKAIGRFETVLKQEPQNTEAMYFLAEAYKGKGEKKKAIELLEKCKKIVNKPDFSRDIDQYINSFK